MHFNVLGLGYLNIYKSLSKMNFNSEYFSGIEHCKSTIFEYKITGLELNLVSVV